MNTIIGFLIGGIAIALFWAYTYSCLKISGVKDIIKSVNKKEYLFISLFFVASTVFIAYIVEKNSFIYYWDYSMHWTPTVALSKTLFTNPSETLKTIYSTIGSTDYNWVMPLLYALPARMFGNSFSAVVLIVYIFYMCPAYFIISICINKFLYLVGFKQSRVFPYILLTFGMPFIVVVLLRGYLDPPVLILSTLILLISCNFQYDHFDWKWSTHMAIGIFTLVLFRRHWAYWVIGLIVSLGIALLFQLHKDTWLITIKYFIINMLYIALFCISLLLFPFRPFLQHSLRNYSSMYGAWNADISAKFLNINEAFGNFLIFIIIAMIFYLLKNRNALEYFIRNWVQMGIPVFVMMTVISIHDAHFYFAVVPILILSAILIEWSIDSIKQKYKKYFVICLLSIYLIFNFLCCFWSNIFVISNSNIFKIAFCNLRYEPFYRDDIQSIQALVDFVNETTEKYDTDCYICASSHNINYHLLSLAYAPDSLAAVERSLPVANIDLSDGFSTNFFDAGVIVLEKYSDDSAEFQTRGNEGVRGFLTEQVMDSETPIGKHYQLLKEFPLHYKYSSAAQVYLKTSDFEEEDYMYMIDYYNKLYPDHQELFSDRISEYMQQHVE